MSSVAAKKPTRSKPTVTKRGKSSKKGEVADTDKIVAAIVKLQQRESKSKLDAIKRRIEIGAQLNRLKEHTKHGEWGKRLASLGYDERTAQRLMKLAESKFDDKIRGIVPELAQRLPIDIEKLEQLNHLTAKQLPECLEAWDHTPETMSRKQLRDTVKAIVDPDSEELQVQPESSSDETEAPLASLLENCRQAADLAVSVDQEIKDKTIGSEAAQQALGPLNKSIETLNRIKQSLAIVAEGGS